MNDFNFWLPIQFAKAKNGSVSSDDDRYANMVFEGIASDSSKDYEGESMEPNGFIIDHFLKHGLFNLDHLTIRSDKLKSRFWIGEPIDGKIINNKFWVKGRLWKDSPEARAFWDKCIEMKNSGSTRQPGMSIEGKVLERDAKNPKHITRAIINNIALTMTPVNFNSYMEIVKGLQKDDYIPVKHRKNDVMFQLVRGNRRLIIDSSFNVRQENL